MGGKKRKHERGGRLVTKNVCAIYYTFYNVMSEDEIKKSRDVGGKIHYLYASIILIIPLKDLYQTVQVMLER